MDRMQRMLLTAAEQRAPQAQTILDVGCGGGSFLFEASLRFRQAELVGIDVAENAVAEAAERLASRIKVIQAPAERLPFGDASFDIVFACRTLHHWTDKRKGLAEVFRVLRQGGLFFLGDGLANGFWGVSQIKRLAERLDGGTFVSSDELEAMLKEVGLVLVCQEAVAGSAKALYAMVVSKA